MATLKLVILAHHKREDGTYNPKIRIIHNRKVKYISTTYYIESTRLTKNLKIKDQNIQNALDDLIIDYRKKCNAIGENIRGMDVGQIINMLTMPKNEDVIDFISFGKQLAKRYEASGKSSSIIITTLNSICRYRMCDTLNISEINFAFLRDYEQWLSDRTKGRAVSLYIGYIRTIHNHAKIEYNDEDSGRILIPQSPFSRYKIPKVPSTRKRSLTIKQINQIVDIPYIETSGLRGNRFNLAKDVFLLSFYLIGMNSVDLFMCTDLHNDRITYNRQKTRSRRDDNAEISILVPEEALELLEKYRDPDGCRVFNFYKKYSNHRNFNQALNKGLKQIGRLLDIEDLEFYAARHSWATIAVNDAGVDKYIVHLGLNHADPTMRITDIYIKKDYSSLDAANRKVIRFVLESRCNK